MANRERRGGSILRCANWRCGVEITTFASGEIEETTFPSLNLHMVRIPMTVAKPLK
jgi:hypothetical protein